MTYKGERIIGKPSLAMIEMYIAEKGMFCTPQDTLNYWEKKNWLNQKGKGITTLESAINVYNGIAVQREIKKNAKKYGYTKLDKKQKRKEKKKIRKELSSGNKEISNEIKKESTNKQTNKIKKEKLPYSEQLKDKRWEAFRKFVFAVRGSKCEKCGSTHILQVHHPKYIRGRNAWEYTCNDVIILCRSCHEKEHNLK